MITKKGKQHLAGLIAGMQGRRILVVGDLMLDRYVIGRAARISPEAPVPVVAVHEERGLPGGAGNVARNIRALGGEVFVCGVVGQDEHGTELLAALNQTGVTTAGVLRPPGLRTTVKTRILAERQQIVRLDWEPDSDLSQPLLRLLCREAEQWVARADGVVITDYDKGVVCKPVVQAVMRAARAARVPVTLDPKRELYAGLTGLAALTPNRQETFALARVKEGAPHSNPLQDTALRHAAQVLYRRWRPRSLLVTLGAQGMLLLRAGHTVHIPALAREVFDVCGAGDTVIATFTLALAAGARPETAAELAAHAAGVVVGKVGASVCSSAELLNYSQAGV